MIRLASFSFLSALSTLALTVALAAGCGPNVVVDHHSNGGGGSSATNAGGSGGSDPCDGLTLCNGSCVNTYNDTFNCGYCNNVCYEGYCSAGGCVAYTNTTTGPVCPGDLTLCDNSCVDIYTDPFNCGSCFIECSSGKCDGGICANGDCSTCSQAITGESQQPPCDGLSSKLYEIVIDCICNGACGMYCGPACQGAEVSPECQDCIGDNATGCGNQVNECLNDI